MKDYIVRAIAADGQIRAFAATTKNMVEEARTRHNMSPIATTALQIDDWRCNDGNNDEK